MKKSLLILALALQTNTIYSDPQVKVQEEGIETLIETTYKHPRARKVGDLMPRPQGEIVSYTFTSGLNIIARETRKVGLITGYDRDGDFIPEYRFINRHCNPHMKVKSHMEVKTYAVLDVPHKLLYIDYSRDNHIDSIVEGVYSLKGVWYIIPKCEQEKISV
ncbi:MAG: hypothetical protein IIA85_01890 [Nanoarchaeota archaeon]|nr:hypothetical protein [Nanoarchaeota archaeon]